MSPKIKKYIFLFFDKNIFLKLRAVDVYKPYGKNIYRYDVNSLYPYIMANNPMPVGNPTLLKGSHNTIEAIVSNKDKVSFVETVVNCPDTINAPILLHILNSKTVAPTGSWKGVYTSMEINRALELGYSFKHIKCVYFDSMKIFDKYVSHYYEMKKNNDKNSSGYTISKLMLNSLYGRFGMSPYLDKHVVIRPEETEELSRTDSQIIDILPLNNGKELVTYTPVYIDDLMIHTNCSIPIAATITAGARVHMSYFKNTDNNTIFYSDTDSIDLAKPLPDKYVGKELGQLKLEHVFEEAIYLAPKMYGGKTKEYEYVKIKGLKNPIHFDELRPLLVKNTTLTAPNEKWYKNLSLGNITIKQEIYTLSVTESKRELIYNKENMFIDTRPININEE